MSLSDRDDREQTLRLYYTPRAIKTVPHCFDNNSGVSWSIFILFVPVEKKRNTVQLTYSLLLVC